MLKTKLFFILAIVLVIFLAGSIFAQESCCLISKNGLDCQDFQSGICKGNCEGDCFSTSCIDVSECKEGCCFDFDEGFCTPNTLKVTCEKNANGVWIDDVLCQVNECNKGCCVIGSESKFVTRARCEKLSESESSGFRFIEGVTDEFECTHLDSRELEEGACVFLTEDEEENNCRLTTKVECKGENERFYSGYLCSHPDMKSSCEKQKTTNCIEERDEVYWFDSCGNRENIYSSDREKSWNNGKILEKEDSCNPDSANTRGNCGNCDYELGSKCGEYRAGIDNKPKYGDYVCQDFNCYDALGNAGATKDRINTESWCVYDGVVGDGKDVVGSEHYMFSCVDGIVESTACSDKRESICVQKKRELSNGEKVDEAFCKINTYENCLGYNSQGGCDAVSCQPFCLLNSDCMLKEIDVRTEEEKAGDNPKEILSVLDRHMTCVPKYPPGFYLSGEPKDIAFEDLFQLIMTMGEASGELNPIQDTLRDLDIDIWEELEISESSIRCSQGSRVCDVAYTYVINVDSVEIRASDVVPLGIVNLESDVANYIGNYMANNPGAKISAYWKASNICPTEEFTKDMNSICNCLGDCGAYVNWAGNVTELGYAVINGERIKNPKQEFEKYSKPLSSQYITPGFFESIEDVFGEEAAEVVGQLFDFGIGLLSTASTGQNVQMPARLGNLFDWGPVMIKRVKIPFTDMAFESVVFNCFPWQRPLKGDCNYCNEQSYKGCTQYRCESLGMNCVMLNDNTNFGKCVEKIQAEGIPVLSPWKEILPPAYKYENIKDTGFSIRTNESKCVESFTPVLFGVKTDIYSMCRMDTENKAFENMTIEFLEGNIFETNHSQMIVLPSVESLFPEIFNQSEENPEQYFSAYKYIYDLIGNLTLYVKCMSGSGEVNEENYNINICVDPGADTKTPWIWGFYDEDEELILPYGAEEYNLSFYANEPVECRWSTEDESYFEMENDLECEESSKHITVLGYECNGILKIPEKNESNIFGNYHTFYFACRDQPWKGEDNSRNTIDGYWVSIEESKEPLIITLIEPSGKITKDAEPASVEVIAMTKGGGKSGLAECRYSIDGSKSVRFSETGGRAHSILFSDIYEKKYNLNITCKDSAGNTASNLSSFELEIDNTPPEVTRVFYYPDSIDFYTNEEALCYYSYDDCDFIIEKGVAVDYIAQASHRISGTGGGKIHYIKCKDVWGNQISNCSAIIKPYIELGGF